MNRLITTIVGLTALLSTGLVWAQTPPSATGTVLGTVRITQPVLANAKPLPPGTYEVRLTNERLPALPGQSPDAERGVEFVANGMVVGTDVAVVTTGADVPVATTGQAARSAIRVDLLKGGDFVRVSASRDGMRYLIHLPVAH